MAGRGSTQTARARQMRRVLARWERSGLRLREYGQRHGIPLSTLTWWRQVFRRAGEAVKVAPAGDAVEFTEVPRVGPCPGGPAILEIVLRNGHVVRVPAGADPATLQRVFQVLQTPC